MNRLILGLGNPGEEYRATRHNVGFRVVEELARRWLARLDRLECNALTARVELPGLPAMPEAAPEALVVLLAMPQTYMNRSGFAARCLVELHGLDPAALLVVYDEVNLPFGRLRLRRSGSPAGHRGIESILENLRTAQVARLRIGIGSPEGPAAAVTAVTAEGLVDHVLSPFTPAEEAAVAPVVQRAADACESWLRDGIDAAMSRFNGAPDSAGAGPAASAGDPDPLP
ncbi:MAG TPA: aminoacyl-tRNA hydrolase [Thermoanaerobaculia bacterium]|nr:aminoacyl-tRNA hydrolase [Thermoanaerobaculia bacterium]